MLPFRFRVHAAVAPTMSAWRDRARMAEVSVTRPCTFLTTLTPSSDGFRRLAGATGGLRDIANGVQARALPCDGDPG
jgi:hypothetical protein